MNVPKHILKYCDELEARINDGTAVLTQSDLAKLAEIQQWYMDYLDHLEPAAYPNSLTDEMVTNIVERMT